MVCVGRSRRDIRTADGCVRANDGGGTSEWAGDDRPGGAVCFAAKPFDVLLFAVLEALGSGLSKLEGEKQ